jgi:hypothetical protein
MKRISSQMTFFYKRVFPIAWFGLLVCFMAVSLISGVRDPMIFIVPIGMMIFGFITMQKLTFDLVDEVVDLGDALLIRNRGREDRVALADIINVSQSQMVNPPRVTLQLRRASAFGSRIAFCAPARLLPFSTSPAIDALITRIDSARRAHP